MMAGSRALMCLLVAALATSCAAAGSTSPTAPSPTVPTFALTGSVAETPPTLSTGLAGATVTVTSGPSAGRTTTTDASGNFTFSGLLAGVLVLQASAANHDDALESVNAADGVAPPLLLAPANTSMTQTFNGTLNPGGAACDDFYEAGKPCQKYLVITHNAGVLDAVVTWTEPTGTSSALSLEVTTEPGTSQSDRLGFSIYSPSEREHVSANVLAGTLYSIRVFLETDFASQPFTVTTTHPR